MTNRRLVLLVWLLGLVCLSVRPAHAGYIDPNSGGLLFQLLAFLFASVSGLILFFSSRIRMGWAQLRRRWRERDKPEA